MESYETMNNVSGVSDSNIGNVVFGRSSMVATQIVNQRNPPQKRLNTLLGTWNVRSFNIEGKLENAIKEMKNMNLAVLGVSETHWMGNDDFCVDKYRVISTGATSKCNGVAIIVNTKMVGDILHVNCINERIMMIKVKSNPVDTIFIQVYMPTSRAKDETIEEIYEMIQDNLDVNKGNSNIIIMGDFNAVVGEGKTNKAMGHTGLVNGMLVDKDFSTLQNRINM